MADLRLSGEFIEYFVRCFQHAMITGTDISDHMRMMRVEVDNDTIVMTDEYKKLIENNETKMLAEAEKLRKQVEEADTDKQHLPYIFTNGS